MEFKINFSPLISDFTCFMDLKKINIVVGKNGAGKTTLFKLIYANSTEKSNHVIPNDVFYGRKMVMNMNELLSLKELRAITLIQSLDPSINQNSPELLSLCENLNFDTKLWNKRIGKISQGETQKVLIMYCLMHRNADLLLDEPLGNLDEASKLFLLKKLKEELNTERAIFVTTHNLDFIESFLSPEEYNLINLSL